MIANKKSKIENGIWARQDSNLGPRDYESPALTAELQARMITQLNMVNYSSPTPKTFEAARSVRPADNLSKTGWSWGRRM
jgi:hypothetical protein